MTCERCQLQEMNRLYTRQSALRYMVELFKLTPDKIEYRLAHDDFVPRGQMVSGLEASLDEVTDEIRRRNEEAKK
jgi:hypothetical protein